MIPVSDGPHGERMSIWLALRSSMEDRNTKTSAVGNLRIKELLVMWSLKVLTRIARFGSADSDSS